MMERMGDTFDILWAGVLAAGVAVIGVFYRHGGRLSAAEARVNALEEAHRENRRWLVKIHGMVNEIQIRLGGINGKRRKGR